MHKGLFDDWSNDKNEFCGTSSGARFSEDRLYRYLLWRPGARPVTFVMLNPSTADEMKDDPTIRRCRGYSRYWGYDGVIIANAFAYRSTDPKALYELEDPIGPENDAYILRAALIAVGPIVCAWGAHGKLHDRGVAVAQLLRAAGHRPQCFGLTKGSKRARPQPWHPLYLPADLQLQDMP
jgi:hypothetical protein